MHPVSTSLPQFLRNLCPAGDSLLCGPCCSETYQYYDLPFCRPKQGLEHKLETLGEVVDGNRLVKTPYELTFRVERDHTILCNKDLTTKELKKFRRVLRCPRTHLRFEPLLCILPHAQLALW